MNRDYVASPTTWRDWLLLAFILGCLVLTLIAGIGLAIAGVRQLIAR